jgi:4-hydroxyphenylacetate 3-monooxygenase
VVKERDDGIVISGAQQLADRRRHLRPHPLSCIHPLQPGDENYANCVAIPVNAPGVRLYPRRPFAIGATNAFDYPLSSRFDESDSYVVFDNVFVPWERVFIYRNIEVSRDQWWKTPSHLYGNHQAQVRYVTKLRFMIGIAQRMNEMTGNTGNPAVQIMMGELAALVSVYETMLLAHETMAPIEDGVLWPSKTALYSSMALQSELNGRMLEIIRELAARHDHAAVLAARLRESGDRRRRRALHALGLIGREIQGRADAARLGLHRFGIRQPPSAIREVLRRASFLVKQNVYRNFDFKRATALVDAALNLPPIAP